METVLYALICFVAVLYFCKTVYNLVSDAKAAKKGSKSKLEGVEKNNDKFWTSST